MALVIYQQCQVAILNTLYEFIYVERNIKKNIEQNTCLSFKTNMTEVLCLYYKRNSRQFSAFISNEMRNALQHFDLK
jgi:hypothetical protein